MSSYSEGQIHQLANALESAGFSSSDLTLLGQHPLLRAVRGFARGTHHIVEVQKQSKHPLLDFIDAVVVPLRGSFEVDVTTSRFGVLRNRYFDPSFTSCFDGRAEAEQPKMSFFRHKLSRDVSYADINAAFGDAPQEITIGQIIWLVVNGEISMSCHDTLFRARDCNGDLRFVSVNYRGFIGRWNFFARDVNSKDRCPGGECHEVQVFSRTFRGF